MLIALLALVGLCLAETPGELALERARAAMGREDHTRALTLIEEAREAGEPEAHQLYLALSRIRHTETLADAEYAHLAGEDPVARAYWLWSRVERGLADLDELDDELPPDLARRVRVALLLEAHDPDAAWALVQAEHCAEEAALAIEARVQQGELREALRLARDLQGRFRRDPELLVPLWHTRSDDRGFEHGRTRLLRATTHRIAERTVLLYRALRLAVAARDKRLASELADRLEALGEPRPLTRHPYNKRMLTELGRALARHAAPELPDAAPSELVRLARVVTGELLGQGRAADAPPVWRQVAQRTDSLVAWTELSLSLLAIEQPQAALQAAERALLQGAHAPAGNGSRRHRARALVATARSHEALGNEDQAIVHFQHAAQLDPAPDTLQALGRLLEEAGELEQAFLVYARARQQGAEGLEQALARCYQGPASWEIAAGAVLSGEEEAVEPTPAEPEAPRYPFLGQPLPGEWQAQDLGGEAVPAPDGQVLVLSFWASWCGPCRQELPQLDRLAARLQSEGLAVRFVGVGVDERVGDYRRFAQRARSAALELVWGPAIGKQLGVRGIPATWVVGADGRLATYYGGYEAGLTDRIEADVRSLVDAAE